MTVVVPSDHPVRIAAGFDYAVSGATVYYKETDDVDTGDPSVTVGNTLTANTDLYVISASSTTLTETPWLETAVPATGRSDFQAAFGPGAGQAGIIVPPFFVAPLDAGAMEDNQAYGLRFIPSRSFNATSITFVTTAAASANDAVDVGLYTSSLAKLVTAGATAGKLNAAAGRQTVAIASTRLSAGTVYYAAISFGAVGGTPAAVVSQDVGTASIPGTRFWGTTAGTVDIFTKASGHPLPDPLTITALSATDNPPILMVA